MGDLSQFVTRGSYSTQLSKRIIPVVVILTSHICDWSKVHCKKFIQIRFLNSLFTTYPPETWISSPPPASLCDPNPDIDMSPSLFYFILSVCLGSEPSFDGDTTVMECSIDESGNRGVPRPFSDVIHRRTPHNGELWWIAGKLWESEMTLNSGNESH